LVDPVRTVAALVESPLGRLLVYGTVMPWCNDAGPNPDAPARGWTEQDRVLPEQIAEWEQLRARHAEEALVVAGDFNMNLGGKHHYGTARGRSRLREGLAKNGLFCATETDRLPVGALRFPPIDHVAVPASWDGRTSVVAAWEGTSADGVRLSDHSGLVVEVLD
jgi:endonuclease/exonuclease/phosphatase family metal-dependent hydrolase